MEPTLTVLGSSLQVPSVQELAKQVRNTVPSRYVRHDQDLPTKCHCNSLPELPVIDLSKLCSEDLKRPELDKLHNACQEWGFFQLINHGVDASLVEKVKLGVHEFFNLPKDEKKKFWQTPGDVEGFGQAFVVSEEQKLDWADVFYMLTLPPSLRKTHLFPNLPLPFRDNLDVYSSELRKLTLKILNIMAEALQMNPRDMNDLFEEGWQSMRMNYYPPCPQPELVIGLNSHSDCIGLTILLQVNEMEGLQIRKNGMWVPVSLSPMLSLST